MRVRIVYGKLRPGTWDAYEAAYKEVMERSGQIPGLRARWLTRDSTTAMMDIRSALWVDEASMRNYETSDLLKTGSCRS